MDEVVIIEEAKMDEIIKIITMGTITTNIIEANEINETKIQYKI